MEKHLPSNVARFEQLSYLSFGISQIVLALQWNQRVALTNRGAHFVLVAQTFGFVLTVLFIWLVARRHKNWARWLWFVLYIAGFRGWVKNLGQMLLLSPVAGILSFTTLPIDLTANQKPSKSTEYGPNPEPVLATIGPTDKLCQGSGYWKDDRSTVNMSSTSPVVAAK